jgi:hypothetical protein
MRIAQLAFFPLDRPAERPYGSEARSARSTRGSAARPRRATTSTDASRSAGVTIAVEPLLRSSDPDLAVLKRLVRHVQRLRDETDTPVLTLRRSDLRIIAIAVGLPPESVEDWLREHELLAH